MRNFAKNTKKVVSLNWCFGLFIYIFFIRPFETICLAYKGVLGDRLIHCNKHSYWIFIFSTTSTHSQGGVSLDVALRLLLQLNFHRLTCYFDYLSFPRELFACFKILHFHLAGCLRPWMSLCTGYWMFSHYYPSFLLLPLCGTCHFSSQKTFLLNGQVIVKWQGPKVWNVIIGYIWRLILFIRLVLIIGFIYMGGHCNSAKTFISQ